MNTRKRHIPFEGVRDARWTIKQKVVGSEFPPTVSGGAAINPYVGSLSGIQVTESENHPGWSRRQPGTRVGDIGGNFYTTKTSAHLSGGHVSVSGSKIIGGFLDRSIQYDGFALPFALAPEWPPDPSSNESKMIAYGTKAISECSPTNALVDLATTLSEILKDGAPSKIGTSIWEERTSAARKAGKEYLNIEFGWKPIVDDIRKTMDAMVRADAVLRQYKRDAGRMVRRRFDFPTQYGRDYTTSHQNVNCYLAVGDEVIRSGPNLQGYVVRTRETSVRRWFSGAFTYHLPYDAEGAVEASQAKHVLGLELTPEVLWNIAPWSWAIDWFIPIGNLLGNLQDWAADGLVLHYGYLMEHSVSEDTYTFHGPTGFLPGVKPGALTLRRETKKRVKASPFGFGLTWDGFSPRQMAILTALGITKGGKS